MIVFRLAHRETGTSLPLHWAYTDPWEESYDAEEDSMMLVDRRESGAQVWDDGGRVIGVAAGVLQADGEYGAEEYPQILVIETTETHDSADEWWAVTPDDVVSVRAIPTETAIRWAKRRAEKEYKEEDDALEAFLKDENNGVAIEKYLVSKSKPVPTTWVETLPRPLLPRQIGAIGGSNGRSGWERTG